MSHGTGASRVRPGAEADGNPHVAAGFDPDHLRSALPPFASAGALPAPGVAAYLAHYGIDFVRDGVAAAHRLGTVASGPFRLAAQVWTPPDAAGGVLLVHGYYDHTGLYGHLIRHLLGRRLAVFAFDLPGHGLSTGAPATIDSFDSYVAAFDACREAAAGCLPRPWHLAGQSTGAAVCMEWLLANGITRANSPFGAVVLLAPLVRPFLWPLNRVVYEIARRFVESRPRTFTGNAENPEFLEFLRSGDPLQARTLPVQWVTAMLARKNRFLRHEPSDLEPLVVQGRADRTVDWRYNVRVIRRLFDPTVVYLPGARHHLVNEAPALRARLFEALDAALDRVAAPKP